MGRKTVHILESALRDSGAHSLNSDIETVESFILEELVTRIHSFDPDPTATEETVIFEAKTARLAFNRIKLRIGM
jgi:hypothetical protein